MLMKCYEVVDKRYKPPLASLKIITNFQSLGVMPYNNRTLCRLRVSDCANKFMGLKF